MTYIATGTDNLGCTGSDELIVDVLPLPLVDAGSDTFVCEGSSYTPSGSGASTYQWSNGLTNNQAFVPTSSQSYTVTAVSYTHLTLPTN